MAHHSLAHAIYCHLSKIPGFVQQEVKYTRYMKNTQWLVASSDDVSGGSSLLELGCGFDLSGLWRGVPLLQRDDRTVVRCWARDGMSWLRGHGNWVGCYL